MRKNLIALAAALASLPSHAQDLSMALLAPGAERNLEIKLGRVDGPGGLVFADGLGFAAHEMQSERVVKGAPYCATAVHESTHTLADGNRIANKQSTLLCRDGEGRTRREVQREGAPRMIYLHDPVAKESWMLDPEKKTAAMLHGSTRFVFRGNGTPGAKLELKSEPGTGELSAYMRDHAERLREWVTDLAERTRARVQGTKADGKASKEGEPGVLVDRELVEGAPGERQVHREVRVIRLGDLPGMPPAPDMPPMPFPPGMAGKGFGLFTGRMPHGQGVSTPLPAKEMEGVKVNGERTTWTLEAGKVGNEKPIVISREVWRSPELMLTVMSRDHDPRSGEVSYRLENIKRGEPDPALMKVPADYRDMLRSPRPAEPSGSGKRG